jgi:hypothetical protein
MAEDCFSRLIAPHAADSNLLPAILVKREKFHPFPGLPGSDVEIPLVIVVAG